MAALRIGGDSNAQTKPRNFFIDFQVNADAISNLLGSDFVGFGQNECEFIAAIARGCINRTAMKAKNVCHTAQCAASGKMAVMIIYALEAVEIHQQN